MKKFFNILAIFALATAAIGCAKSDDGKDNNGGNGSKDALIKVEEVSIKGTSAEFKIIPTDKEEEYCVFVVEKANYNPSNTPSTAKYVTGDYTAKFTDLQLGTDYCLGVAAEMIGYTGKHDFKTLGSNGTTDPSGRPNDFIIKNIPMKQKRSEKRGISGNLQGTDDPSLLGKGVSWNYNWGGSAPAYVPQMDKQNMTFLPMAWNELNNNSLNSIKSYTSTHPNAKYLLGFNEPNLKDQANMTPTQCAPKWNALKTQVQQTGLKLISPALNYGTLAGYNDPEKWMDEFLACEGVSKDDFEAIALHCYMPNVGGMRAMIHKFEKYGKPIWMTEFCHAEGNISPDPKTQLIFMSDIMNYLETDPLVGGYSWFIVRDWKGINLIEGNELNDLGKLYVNFSSFDKTCYYKEGEPIPAAHYTAHNLSDRVYPAEWGNTFMVAPTTDAYGDLMLSAYQVGAWTEYQIEPTKSKTYGLAIRFISTIAKGTFDISIDGKVVKTVVLPKDEIWETAWTDLDLTAGKHTLRITCKSGRADINWLYLN